ncbi:hypothetical protein ACFFYR_15175 [Paraburkholderia dipogonis]|uniref:hypothetical protein n=1 Tax=Paraburkholderia dipogonis TaxID=1211383 RepID=UPI0035F05B21
MTRSGTALIARGRFLSGSLGFRSCRADEFDAGDKRRWQSESRAKKPSQAVRHETTPFRITLEREERTPVWGDEKICEVRYAPTEIRTHNCDDLDDRKTQNSSLAKTV